MMSNQVNSRSAPQSDRIPSSTFGRRGLAARAGTRERPPSSEVAPDDSASNASHRRVPSAMNKVNGVSRNYGERQTVKTATTTRDSLQFRTRSPVKSSFENADANGPRPKSRHDARTSPRVVQTARKERPVQCPYINPSSMLVG